MAGVMMTGDEGKEVQNQSVPAIGGAAYRATAGVPVTTVVVESAHLGSDYRAEGVAYPENSQVSLDGSAYPAGTDNGEASNPLKP